jgi:hypothetical protein
MISVAAIGLVPLLALPLLWKHEPPAAPVAAGDVAAAPPAPSPS